MNSISNILFVVSGDGQEGRIARRFLEKRQIDFTEIQDLIHSKCEVPTLVVFGVHYLGLAEIKLAADIDINL